MEAIILAGGFGTRLQKLVRDVPKPMAEVSGRPFLEILLRNLAQKGFRRILMSVGYKAEKIISHFGHNYMGMDILYSIEESPLGTGGGARLAMARADSDHIYIFNGDTFIDLEIEQIEHHWSYNRRPLIVGQSVSDTARYGRLCSVNGVARSFSEKGIDGPGLINAGTYVLNNGQLDSYPIGQEFSLELDYLSNAIPAGQFDVFISNGIFIDIGIPSDYRRAQRILVNY